MTRLLVIPDLPMERWHSMDRYASRLIGALRSITPAVPFDVAVDLSRVTTNSDSSAPDDAQSPGELRRYYARYWAYPRRVRQQTAALWHVLDHSYGHLLLERRPPAVVTVHDLLPHMTIKQRPRSMRERLRNRFLRRVLRGLKRADAFIVSTQWMRHELLQWLQLDRDVHVIPYGVDAALFDPAPMDRSASRAHWGIPDKAFVVLHVGSTGPRKNLPMVIRVVAALRKSGVDAWLLQIGGQFDARLTLEIEEARIASYVLAPGETTEPALRSAYGAADLLLFPSLYEGFGLPVIEAMAAGLPVVTSDAAALREVAGDAAMVVPGREVEPYVAAVARFANDAGAAALAGKRGREYARQFTWERTARLTSEVYHTLV